MASFWHGMGGKPKGRKERAQRKERTQNLQFIKSLRISQSLEEADANQKHIL